jgi:protein O-mannosyl-transferase
MGRRPSHDRPAASDRSRRPRRGVLDTGQRNAAAQGARAFVTTDRLVSLLVCGLLLAAVALVFAQAARFEFVNFDDDGGVYENRLVTKELTLKSVLSIFTERHFESWAPLTCLSHMLAWHLLGHGPAVHHIVNVLLHAASAVLLYLVLQRMTGQRWPSALVAALFAVHPLHTESVAWVTERKDALSGLFFMLTLAAYHGYARRPFSPGRYLMVLVCLSVGLAAKPMAVTLPLLLLLLDYWPLERLSPRPWGEGTMRLLLEKLPLLAVAAVFCLVNIRGQGAALDVNELYSFCWRMGNAVISSAVYLGQSVLPVGLAACYPRRCLSLSFWQIGGAVLVLAAVSTVALACRRRRPYLLVGWLWYLVMLLPVIGLVQFGLQAEADRFTYLPQIGLAIAVAWTAAEGARRRPRFGWLSSVAAACLLSVLMVFAWRQTSYWTNSQTLWTRVLACTSENAAAHTNLGAYFGTTGRPADAIIQYRHARAIDPKSLKVLHGLGTAYLSLGQLDEAEDFFRKALAVDPADPGSHSDLGFALTKRGRYDEALEHYRQALAAEPDFALAHYNFGLALYDLRRFDEASQQYREALRLQTNNPEVYNNLGNALTACGRLDEAIPQFEESIRRKPDYAAAHFNLALALIGKGRFPAAELHCRRAIALQPDIAPARVQLGRLLARQGKWDEAIDHYRQALQIAPGFLEARCDLAAAQFGRGDFPAAIAQWKEVLRLTPDDPEALRALAAAQAEVGQFAAATATAQAALALAQRQHNGPLAAALKADLARFEARPSRRSP